MKKISLILISFFLFAACAQEAVEYTSVTDESLDVYLKAYPAYIEKAKELGYGGYQVGDDAVPEKAAKILEKELSKYRLSPETFGLLMRRVTEGYTTVQMQRQVEKQQGMLGSMLSNIFTSEVPISEAEMQVIKNNFDKIDKMYKTTRI